MSLERENVGRFLVSQAEELARIWRIARSSAHSHVFPGLIDGLVAPFFTRAGDLLERGEPAEEAWRGLAGVLRCSASLPTSTMAEEWALLAEVATAACESVNASRGDSDWLARAIAAAAAGAGALVSGDASSSGVLVAHVFDAAPPRQRTASPQP